METIFENQFTVYRNECEEAGYLRSGQTAQFLVVLLELHQIHDTFSFQSKYFVQWENGSHTVSVVDSRLGGFLWIVLVPFDCGGFIGDHVSRFDQQPNGF